MIHSNKKAGFQLIIPIVLIGMLAVGCGRSKAQKATRDAEFSSLQERAKLQFEGGEFTKALELLRQMQRLKPDHAGTFCAIGQILGSPGPQFNRAEAIRALNEFARLAQDERYHDARVQVYNDILRLENGETLSWEFVAATESVTGGGQETDGHGLVNPRDFHFLVSQVAQYRRAGDANGMLKVLLEMKEWRPTEAGTAFMLGEVYGSEGPLFDKVKALDAFEDFLKQSVGVSQDSCRNRAQKSVLVLKSGNRLPALAGNVIDSPRNGNTSSPSIIELQTLDQIGREAAASADEEQHAQLMSEYMAKGAVLLKEHADILKLWMLRAVAAMELEDKEAACTAGQQIQRLAPDSADPRIVTILAMLNRLGWLQTPEAPMVAKATVLSTNDSETARTPTATNTAAFATDVVNHDLIPVDPAMIPDLSGLAPGSVEALQNQKNRADKLGCSIEQRTRYADIRLRFIPYEGGHDFWLGMYEVTQAQWEKVTGSNPTPAKLKIVGRSDLSVAGINTSDARQFCEELSLKEGVPSGTYFVPTEIQWEYACRAGTRTETYAGDRYWKFSFPENRADHFEPGKKMPNAFGLYDTLGCLWELCDNGQSSGTDVSRGWCTYPDISWRENHAKDYSVAYRLVYDGRKGASGLRVARKLTP